MRRKERLVFILEMILAFILLMALFFLELRTVDIGKIISVVITIELLVLLGLHLFNNRCEKERIVTNIRLVVLGYMKYYARYVSFLKHEKNDLRKNYPFDDLLNYTCQIRINLYSYLCMLDDNLSIYYKAFLSNFDDFILYLQELNMDISNGIKEMAENEYQLVQFYDNKVREIIKTNIVFLDDYFDLLMMDFYPLLDKKNQRKFKHLFDEIKNDE